MGLAMLLLGASIISLSVSLTGIWRKSTLMKLAGQLLGAAVVVMIVIVFYQIT